MISYSSSNDKSNDFLSYLDEQPVELINNARMRVGDFHMIKVIGRGAFGEVQLVSYSKDHSC